MMDIAPKVLFSYSWDSEDHKVWVRDLASRLVRNGVDVRLDEWHVQPGESLTTFMESNITNCDFVVIICTPNYAERSISRRGGVGYEQQIISGNIVSGANRKKFIPVVRQGNFEVGVDCAIPPHFLGIRAVDMRASSDDNLSFEILLRALWDEPALTPPTIGARPTFGTSESRPVLGPVRLPTAELDGYFLRSAVANNQLFPDTFHIPPEDERQKVSVGDYVKLYFGINPSKDADEVEFERMWVQITGSNGAYLTGVLENEPACEHERNNLKYKDSIVFLPEHILNIMTVEELEFYEEAKKYDEEIAGLLWQHGIVKEDRQKFLQSLADGSLRRSLEMGGSDTSETQETSTGGLLENVKAFFRKML